MSSTERRRLLIAGTTLLALPASVISLGTPARAQTRSVVDTLAADGRFDRFLEMLGRAGMVDQLRGAGPFTIFAPTDAAFNAASVATLDAMLNQGTGGGGSGTGGGGGVAGGASPDPVRLPAFVRYFIIPGQTLTSGQLRALGEGQLPTLNGSPLLVRAPVGQPVTLTNPAPGQATGGFGAPGINVMPPAPIVTADIPATNGIVHALGGVVFP
jgi:uncharacterized surface protein with fasciclin (FAS1) repeats